MRAWVFVFDHPWFQLTGPDGAFRLTNVPPGDYRLDVVHPAGELRSSQTITVKPDETRLRRMSPESRRSPESNEVIAPSKPIRLECHFLRSSIMLARTLVAML